MLYMIGMVSMVNQRPACLLKIGYAKNVANRMKAYKTHNPTATPMYSIAGGKALEKRYHSILAQWGNKVSGEWYQIPFELYKTCHVKGFYCFPIKFKVQHRLT